MHKIKIDIRLEEGPDRPSKYFLMCSCKRRMQIGFAGTLHKTVIEGRIAEHAREIAPKTLTVEYHGE